ncbi:hypothetical protein V1511DRAFT_511785 [Dipodascopsis uninucleata]
MTSKVLGRMSKPWLKPYGGLSSVLKKTEANADDVLSDTAIKLNFIKDTRKGDEIEKWTAMSSALSAVDSMRSYHNRTINQFQKKEIKHRFNISMYKEWKEVSRYKGEELDIRSLSNEELKKEKEKAIGLIYIFRRKLTNNKPVSAKEFGQLLGRRQVIARLSPSLIKAYYRIQGEVFKQCHKQMATNKNKRTDQKSTSRDD